MLIDWFCTFLRKLPYGYNSRVNAKSDSTQRDNTVLFSIFYFYILLIVWFSSDVFWLLIQYRGKSWSRDFGEKTIKLKLSRYMTPLNYTRKRALPSNRARRIFSRNLWQFSYTFHDTMSFAFFVLFHGIRGWSPDNVACPGLLQWQSICRAPKEHLFSFLVTLFLQL